eukprot:Phypoly_transcript_09594.p1 GENE.Phypoly_transcript_09594~~Phypoly_transcript_09594.p1  ORF type:complete len:457 (+),score=23.96 Phypoly_transcript_09594:99-1373(+)
MKSASSVNAEYETETDRLLETPYEDKPKSSDLQAFVNTIKSFVGVGILEFPYAVQQSGLYAGIVLLLFIGIVSNYTMKTLVRCKDEIKERLAQQEEEDTKNGTKNHEITYGDIGKYTFGPAGLYAVNFAIISSQIGFCCAYVIFIATNLNSMFPEIHMRYFSLMYFPVFMLLSWLRNIKYLAPTSIFANFALLFAVAVILGHGFANFHIHHYTAIEPKGLPIFFGIAVFGFEGINLALPIQASMKNQDHYWRVLDKSMLVVGISYIAFGSLGYVCYGDNTESVITLSLPLHSAITTVVKVFLITELTFSYPVQLFPVHTICEAGMITSKTPYKWFLRSGFRACLVAVTVGIAVFIPHFDLFTALVGAFSNSLVTFIFPPIFFLWIFRRKLLKIEIIVNIVILLLGIGASSISSYTAVKNIIHQL